MSPARSKNDDFVAFAQKIADIALDTFPASKESMLAQKFDNITVGEKITEQVGVIGEKVELTDYERLEGDMIVPLMNAKATYQYYINDLYKGQPKSQFEIHTESWLAHEWSDDEHKYIANWIRNKLE